MTYYVLANDNEVKFSTREAAELFSYTMLDDDKVEYLEYGVINYDGWRGRLPIAVLKPFNTEVQCSECVITD